MLGGFAEPIGLRPNRESFCASPPPLADTPPTDRIGFPPGSVRRIAEAQPVRFGVRRGTSMAKSGSPLDLERSGEPNPPSPCGTPRGSDSEDPLVRTQTEVTMNSSSSSPSPSSAIPSRSLLSRALRPLAAAAVLAATGCTTQTQTFEGYSDEQVWSAMVAAARSPEYDDWKIAENEMFVDEEGRRLEVYRVVRRLYVTPHSEPLKESREWRMQMVLAHDDEAGAPVVDFTARQITVPAHVWAEADRYFNQVRSLLGPARGLDTPPGPAAAPSAETTEPVAIGAGDQPTTDSNAPAAAETADLP